MMRAIKQRAGSLACTAICLLTVVTAAHAEVPTNTQLIAAMPPATESVLIRRYSALASEESALKNEAQQTIDGLGDVASEEERNALLNVVLRYVAMADPVVHAEGGSDFTRITGDPGGIGVGNYNSRSIWCVERSLDRLKKRLAEQRDLSGDVKTFTLDDVPAYETEVRRHVATDDKVTPVQEKRFVAFPSDHCVVITEDRNELEQILTGLKSKAPEVPEKWRVPTAGLELQSAIVLLRRYDPQNELDYYSPVSPKKPAFQRVNIESVALVLPSVNRLAFRIKCISEEPRKAVVYFACHTLRQEAYRWKTNVSDVGFEAEVAAIDENRDVAYPMLVLYMLFGPNVFI